MFWVIKQLDAEKLYILIQVKVYESLFGNAKLHASSFSTEVSPTAVNIPKTMNLRPLSPHLSIYKPQPTSMSSIFHRIAFIVLATSILSSAFLYLGIGPILFHHEMVYNIFFYLSMLWPIIAMVNALALSYYVYVGIHHSKPLLGALVNKVIFSQSCTIYLLHSNGCVC